MTKLVNQPEFKSKYLRKMTKLVNQPEFKSKHGLACGDSNIVTLARNDYQMFLDGSLPPNTDQSWLVDALKEAGYSRLALLMQEIEKRMSNNVTQNSIT